jgi:endonuclease/exonuclease/phosphatase family metal-dependent hydrolase
MKSYAHRPGSAKVAVPAVLALIAGAAVTFMLTFDRGAAERPSPISAPAPTAPAAAATAPAPAADGRVQGVRRWGIEAAKPKPEGTIRLAAYNLENLFDHVDDPTLSGEDEDLEDAKPDDECKALALAIRAVNADVLGLQEIESEAALKWFRDTYLSDMGYVHLVSLDAGDGRGIEQAVLSRFPIRDVKNWPNQQLAGTHPDRWGNEANPDAGKPIEFARSPLRVTIDAPGTTGTWPLTLFVVHHKSGGPGGYWREAEAKAILAHAAEFQQANPGQPVAILGDFNAQPQADSITAYTAAGWHDAFADRAPNDPAFVTHSSGRVIDFIFLNPAAKARLVPESRFILGTPDRPAGVDWRNTPNPIGWASDHYPVVIDLRKAQANP